jgi:two-component system chemotaxis sensor kinase CheA
VSSPDRLDFQRAFLADYFAEVDEHLLSVRRTLHAAEQQGGALRPAALDELFRSFHSIKGLSGMVELREAELLAHHMESQLRELRGRSAKLLPTAVASLIAATRTLEQVVAARRNEQPPPAIDKIIAQLEQLENAATTAEDSGEAEESATPTRTRWRATFAPTPELSARGVGVDQVRKLLGEVSDIVDAVPRVSADGRIRFEFTVDGWFSNDDAGEWAERGVAIERAPQADSPETLPDSEQRAAPAANPLNYVRVDLARLDDLMRMIGDLVISRARLAESLARMEPHVPAPAWRTVQDNSLAIERQLRGLREGVMRVRLVPVGEIFRRMPFVVRDLALAAGKKVELDIRGQSTEIDKFVVERMLDPIVHLVRNAVSHGIEATEERIAAGKPETAVITLSAASVGDLVVLEIADDGRGVDHDAVARRARELGLAVPEDTSDPEALLDILCAPGFSMREAADRASGRGVGMSVVQTTIQELGGRLFLDTEPGHGTRFIIELPLTLAITDAIIATIGSDTFAVTQSAIREVIEIDPAQVRLLENNEIAPYRDGVLPIVRLANAFKMSSKPHRGLHVFVIGQGASVVGLAVDRIVGQREIVVRPLADALVKVEGVVGATDLGDGHVVLILDAQQLAALNKERIAPSRV